MPSAGKAARKLKLKLIDSKFMRSQMTGVLILQCVSFQFQFYFNGHIFSSHALQMPIRIKENECFLETWEPVCVIYCNVPMLSSFPMESYYINAFCWESCIETQTKVN